MGDFQNKILIAKFSSTQACQPPASPATGNCPRSCLCKAFSGRQWEIAHFCFPRICSLLEKHRSNALKTQSERKWESLPLNTIPNSCWGIIISFSGFGDQKYKNLSWSQTVAQGGLCVHILHIFFLPGFSAFAWKGTLGWFQVHRWLLPGFSSHLL